jgi:hypothetical protein
VASVGGRYRARWSTLRPGQRVLDQCCVGCLVVDVFASVLVPPISRNSADLEDVESQADGHEVSGIRQLESGQLSYPTEAVAYGIRVYEKSRGRIARGHLAAEPFVESIDQLALPVAVDPQNRSKYCFGEGRHPLACSGFQQQSRHAEIGQVYYWGDSFVTRFAARSVILSSDSTSVSDGDALPTIHRN